jgi:hypothetical protein
MSDASDVQRALICPLFVALAACGTSSAAQDAASDAPVDVEAGTALRANGTVGPWQTLAPLAHARANFCAAVVGSYVVTIGGNYASDGGFTKLDEIDVAKFHDDGTLDPWQVAGHAPSPVTECTAVGVGSTLYVIDGIYDNAANTGHVYSADLAADGTLPSGLAQAGTLPAGIDTFDALAFSTGDHVWATVSKLSGSCALLRGPASAPLDAWDDLDFLSEFRGRPQWATANVAGTTYAYVLGGYSDADAGNVVLKSGAGAQIVPSGVQSPIAVADLPKPTTFGLAASADDWVFVIGGRDQIFGGTPRSDVISAQAGASGALGAWTARAPLPSPRTNGAAVVAGNYLYVLGGANASATDTVYAAQVRF